MMIGTVLGNRYELIEKIGEGGMAEVYKAKCNKLNRFDAVKILKKEFSSDTLVVEKFKREATAVANLSDNNIVNVLDVGTQDDINYIVMEYVKGKTLKDVIRENGKIPYTKAVGYGIEIAKALDCAHRNNIIHRDVKPQNILVTEDDIIKVTDFGIAKSTDSATITNTSKILGSAHYFSPEQAKGNYIDYRTDIYSLGIVLYEMVTGRLPFDADSPVSVALKHIQEQPVPPININDTIPESLNSLILKAIEKDPIKRYSSCKEIINDLIKIKRNENIDVTPKKQDDQFTRVMSPITDEDIRKSNANKEANKPSNSPKKNIKDEELDEYEDDDDYEDEDYGKSNKKKFLILSLVGILVIALGAIGAAMVFKPSDKKAESIEVPQIIGLSQEEAKKLLESKGLKMEIVGENPDDKYPEGSIVSSHPGVGEKVEKGKEVRVIISGGVEKLKAPNIKEIDKNAAENILKSFGLSLVVGDPEHSDTVPSGKIISQSPEEGKEIKKGDSITVVISKGPKTKYTTVPNLRGQNKSNVPNILKSNKLTLGDDVKEERKVTNNRDDLNKNYTVISQSLEAGKEVAEGSVVYVTVIVYEYKEPEPELINIPGGIKGATVRDARAIIEGAGFTFNNPKGFKDDDIVKSYGVQNGKGNKAPKGSTITMNEVEEKKPEENPNPNPKQP